MNAPNSATPPSALFPHWDDATLRAKLLELFAFAREGLGYKDISDFHLGWYDQILRNRFVLLLSPRGHLKTSAVSTAYALWRLTQNRNLRILILNEVLGNSKDILSSIKAHIASDKFRELHGNWDTLSEMWTAEKILIPRDKVLKEPSISVAGILGTILSSHADLILLDDPQGDRNSKSSFQRKKIMSWFQKVVLPILEPGGQIVTCMTRWNRDDLAGVIMSEPGFKNWKVIEQRAEWTDERGNRKILFPQKFSPETLDQYRANMGSAAYRLQFLNDIAGQEEDSAFRIEWIESGRFDKPPESLRVYCGIDLAISEKRGASNWAYIVIGLDRTGCAFVLDGFRGHIGVVDQIAHAKRIWRVFNPVLMVAEATGYQGVFGQLLRVDPETRRMPLQMLSVNDPKEARISGLSPLVQSGAIRLPRLNFATWVSHLEEEMAEFPNGNDDMLDALVLALRAVRVQKSEPRITFTDDIE
ncbi:MAG TPA: hypothetical protein DEB40_03320 [Elusimicrobia bacterium]|nr:hypothetical protein [Elusimicrobiota bacterium]HBT60758.1 hypothetical protein [Elusimicrobiota bacterium]